MTAWLWVPALLAPALMAVLLVLDLLERGVRLSRPLDPGGRDRPRRRPLTWRVTWRGRPDDRGRAAQGRIEAE